MFTNRNFGMNNLAMMTAEEKLEKKEAKKQARTERVEARLKKVHYREADHPECESCGTCMFYSGLGMYCHNPLVNTQVNPTYICDKHSESLAKLPEKC